MKLDNEQDRHLLLQIMRQAQIPGAVAAPFADLMRRVQAAEVEGEPGTSSEQKASASR